MRLRIRNPFYFKEDLKWKRLVRVVCHHCGATYYVSHGEIRVGNYCMECK
jgi:hypothetical protein